MNFRQKVFYIIIGGLTAMGASLLFVSQLAYRWTSDSIARQETLHTFEHARALVLNELEHLQLVNADWSVWDDAYEYAEKPNKRFASANLQGSAFKTINISSISIYDRNDRLVFAYPSASAFPADSESLTALRAQAMRTDSAADIIEADGSFFFAAVHGILRSDGSGPSAGTLTMTRPADKNAFKRIEEILESEIMLERAGGEQAETAPRIVAGDNKSMVALGSFLPEGSANSELLIRVRPEKRNITYSAATFVKFLLIGILIASAVAVLILLLLDRYVVRRIDRIGKELMTAALSKGAGYRVTVDGNDEISRLGKILNKTFDSLENTLRERESLLQEIRHRVKNNLQVIASLLSLQSDEAADLPLKAAYANTQRRVLAMAFVHEEMYCLGTLDAIRLPAYLDRLSILVRHALDPAGSVKFEFSAEDLGLSIERAMPFALISNEVLTNAFTHAFPDDGREEASPDKRISLSLRKEGDHCVLEVADNGCGIPPLSQKKGALGLTLIGTLASQMQAGYTYAPRPDRGTVFRLVFKCDADSC